MKNITEQQFKEWFESTCIERSGVDLSQIRIALTTETLYDAIWEFIKVHQKPVITMKISAQ